MTLPACFCWTRFGTEAGQSIDQIFERKEQERAANGGLFFGGSETHLVPQFESCFAARQVQKCCLAR